MVITLSVVDPFQLVLIPLALLLVALPPRSPGVLVLAMALAVLAFLGPRGTLWHVERGWALLVGGWFIAAVVVWPGGSTISRALAAVAASLVTAAALIGVRGGWPAIDHTIAGHYRDVAETVARTWSTGRMDGDALVEWVADIPALVFPALTALASAASLAVAWWVSGRITGMPRPLGRLTRFRFPDILVWVLIAGLALVLMPPADWGSRLGVNLLVFMGALYALRGLAVMVALVLGMVGSSWAVLAVLAIVGVVLYPIVVAGTLLLGVTDTWLDLRSGRRAVNDEG